MLTTKVKLGIGTLFACLSILLLSLVAPKVSALYHRGDFGDENPLDLISIAQTTYDTYWNTSLNWDNYQHSFLTKNADNGYYYYYFGNWNNVDGVPRIYANMPLGNDRVTIYGDIGYIKFDTEGNYLSGMNLATGSSTYLYGWQETYYFSVSTTIQFNNGSWSYTPEEEYTNVYDAAYYIGSSAYNIVFGVVATENSIYNGWWVETIPYKVNIQLTYNNQPLVYTVPSYTSYYMDLRHVAILFPFPVTQQINPYWSFTDTLHQIKYMPTNYDGYFDSGHTLSPTSLTSPIIEYSSEWVDPNYEDESNYNVNGLQTVSLSSLMSYIQEDYPNFTFSDFQQDMTVAIIGANDNHTYYSNILRYSEVDFPVDAPPSDPDVPDWFQDLSDLINQYNAEKTFNYLFNLPNSYSPIAKVGSLGTLTSIDEPSYDFQPIEDLDTDAMGFFSWLVNLIVNSPIGVLMLFALTFLVVSAVIK